jgi:hypothetical protein
MHRIAFCIFAWLVSVQNSFAQQDTTLAERSSDVVIGLTNVAYIAPSFLILLPIHELGHCTFAYLGGAEDVRFGLHRGHSFGWADWKGNLPGVWDPLTQLGGVLFTRGLAEGTDCLIRNTNMPNWAQRFFSMMFLESRLDFPRYVLLDATLNLFNSKGSDFDQFVTDVAGRKTGWRTLTYSVLIAACAFDLIWDWDRIVRHWNVLAGKPYRDVKSASQSHLRLRPLLSNGTLGLVASFAW